MKITKYIIFTYDLISASLIYKLLKEGNTVIVGMVQKAEEMEAEESKEDEKLRLANYDGIFEKFDAEEVLKIIKNIENKDEWFVYCDFNNLYKYGEACVKMGFKNGLFPFKEDDELEANREKAKEIVQKEYPGLKLTQVHQCQNIEEGKEVMEQLPDKIFVLKGNYESAKTFVPSSKIPELARKQVNDTLEAGKTEYEKEGFILEEKVNEPLEITPEAMFWNGKLIATTIDIENKPLGSGNIGDQTGCSECLVFKTNPTDKINRLAFPKFAHDMAKKHPGLFIIDASLLCKGKDYYFGEFCFNRFGWDSVFNEIMMAGGSVGEFFNKIANGENPFIYNYGVSVRGFNLPEKDSGHAFKLEPAEMSWLESVDNNIFCYELKRDAEKKITSLAGSSDLVVVAAAGNSIKEAVDKTYKAMEGFSFEDLYYRPKSDFNSTDYPTSIPNRYEYGKKQGFYDNKVILRLK